MQLLEAVPTLQNITYGNVTIQVHVLLESSQISAKGLSNRHASLRITSYFRVMAFRCG
jgi:hypothetical protein